MFATSLVLTMTSKYNGLLTWLASLGVDRDSHKSGAVLHLSKRMKEVGTATVWISDVWQAVNIQAT